MMTEKEVFEVFKPRKLASQAEFEQIMGELSFQQSELTKPLREEMRDINVKKDLLKLKQNEIYQKLLELNMELHSIEEKQRRLYGKFHDIKHNFILLNPKPVTGDREKGND